MSTPERPTRQTLTRADLPADLTPDSLRGLSFMTLRHFADHRNGVLDAAEQRQFDAALREVMRTTTSRIDAAVRRAPRGGPVSGDPTLSRSYERAQRRLADQARHARERFPELTLDQPDDATPGLPGPDLSDPSSPVPPTTTPPTSTDAADHDVSPAAWSSRSSRPPTPSTCSSGSPPSNSTSSNTKKLSC